ncbi:MAG: rod shape-determining protein RodA [Coriobacteriia bacterium]|nr:rod shape-determining protein RodA [Coriobacteriia bacterium]
MALFRYDIRRNVNFTLVIAVAALLVVGTTIILSATSAMEDASSFLYRQIIGIAIGLVLMVCFWLFDYRNFADMIVPLWIVNLFLILAPRIPGLGSTAGGSERWLAIGGRHLFQPSEPAKLVTILLFAAIVARYEGEIPDLLSFIKLFAISLIPAVLIMLIPDLGTGLVFVAISLGILWVGGAHSRTMILLILVGLLCVIGFVFTEINYSKTNDGDGRVLKEYQLNRLIVFVDPDVDPQGAGYNLEQSMISIGSGEFSGKGLGSGSQTTGNFLPERHTDFIFAVLGEEMGFMGGLLLMGLYLALLMACLSICASSIDLFGSLIATGIMSMWAFQILENAGMTMGLMPITGIPLPFMSYGSSFLVTSLACVGVLLSIWRRRNYQSPIKGVDDDETSAQSSRNPGIREKTRATKNNSGPRRSSPRPHASFLYR